MSLNCMGPLNWDFFLAVNTAVVHDLQLFESVDAEAANTED